MGWGEYAWSHAPIPLTGPAKYIYDQLRHSGATVHDIGMWMRALMQFGVAATTGTELKEDIPTDQAKTSLNSNANS
jgi:hypothetical protein